MNIGYHKIECKPKTHHSLVSRLSLRKQIFMGDSFNGKIPLLFNKPGEPLMSVGACRKVHNGCWWLRNESIRDDHYFWFFYANSYLRELSSMLPGAAYCSIGKGFECSFFAKMCCIHFFCSLAKGTSTMRTIRNPKNMLMTECETKSGYLVQNS